LAIGFEATAPRAFGEPDCAACFSAAVRSSEILSGTRLFLAMRLTELTDKVEILDYGTDRGREQTALFIPLATAIDSDVFPA
jgi:hypothetical protein